MVIAGRIERPGGRGRGALPRPRPLLVAAAALAVVALLLALRLPGPARRAFLERAPDAVLRWEASFAPDDPWPRFLLGMRLARRGDPPAGFRLVQEGIALAPRVPELALGAAEIQMNLGDAAGALAEARRAVEIAPGSALSHRVLGQMALDTGDTGTAERALREATRLDPRDPEAWQALGSLYNGQQGRVPEAREALERAVAVAPRFAAAHRDLAAALIRAGALAEAERHVREALRLEPGDARSHAELGAVLRRAGPGRAGDEAERALRRALELDPAPAGAEYELGLLLSERGDDAGARSALEAAVRLAPRRQGGWYHLARVCDRLGDRTAARRARARYRLLSETQAAVAAAMRAMDRDPASAPARLELARLHVRREEWPEAVEHLNAALKLEPASAPARELAAALRRRGIVRQP